MREFVVASAVRVFTTKTNSIEKDRHTYSSDQLTGVCCERMRERVKEKFTT